MSAHAAILTSERFSLGPLLGHGGTGRVYRALDRRTGESVALKRLHRSGPEELYRVKREFRLLRGIHHPHIVQFFDLFTDVEAPFYTMELIDGRPLLPALAHAPRTEQLTALGQLAEALAALHVHGCVHRDLKSDNVLVDTRGRVVLVDMGMASTTRPADQASQRRSLAGTPVTMAPEQLSGQAVSPAADWYAFACLAWELLCGQPPFGPTWEQALRQKLTGPPEPHPGLPEALVPWLLGALATSPEVRPGPSEILSLLGARPLGGEVPFVGREDLMVELLAQVRSKEDRFIVILGPSGRGKSRLVRQLAGSLESQGHLVLAGACAANESVPFRGLDGMVDDLSRALQEQPRPLQSLERSQREALVRAFPVLGRAGLPQDNRDRSAPTPQLGRLALEALERVLLDLSSYAPVLLVLDDLQWIDQDSATVLRRLLERGGADLGLVATLRTESEQAPSSLPLDVDRAHILALPPLPADAIVSLTDGSRQQVPLAPPDWVREYPVLLADWIREGTDAPESIHAWVARRLEGQSAAENHTLSVLALAEDGLDEATLLRDQDLTRKRLRTLETLGLVRATSVSGGPGFEVAHSLIREVLLAEVAPVDRPRLHLALARRLQSVSDPRPGLIMAHYQAGGDREGAAAHAVKAAHQARSAFAFHREAELLGAALELLSDDAPASLLRNRARALRDAGQLRAASTAYRRASDAGSGDTDLKLEAAECEIRCGDLTSGVPALVDALRASGVQVPSSKAARLFWTTLMRAVGRLRTVSVDLDRTWRASLMLALHEPVLSDWLVALHERGAQKAGDPSHRARAMSLRAVFIGRLQGWPFPAPDAVGLAMRAVALADASGSAWDQAWARQALACVHYLGARMQPALEAALEAESRFEALPVGAHWELAGARVWLASPAWNLGRMTVLQRVLRQERREIIENGDFTGVEAGQYWTMVIVALVRDEPDEADQALSWARSRRHEGRPAAVPVLGAAEAIRHLYVGDAASALRAFIDGESALKASGIGWIPRMIGELGLVACVTAQTALLEGVEADSARAARRLLRGWRRRIRLTRLPTREAQLGLVRAGDALLRGDRPTAVATLEHAEEAARREGLAMLEAVAGALLEVRYDSRPAGTGVQGLEALGVRDVAQFLRAFHPGDFAS